MRNNFSRLLSEQGVPIVQNVPKHRKICRFPAKHQYYLQLIQIFEKTLDNRLVKDYNNNAIIIVKVVQTTCSTEKKEPDPDPDKAGSGVFY